MKQLMLRIAVIANGKGEWSAWGSSGADDATAIGVVSDGLDGVSPPERTYIIEALGPWPEAEPVQGTVGGVAVPPEPRP